MGYDLILQSHPGAASGTASAEAVWAQLCTHFTIVDCCQADRLDQPPSAGETMMLKECLDLGEVDLADFETFCRDRQLPPDPQDVNAAAAFLWSLWGRSLVTVTLPTDEEDVRQAYADLVAIARAEGLRLVDPQAGHDIDLSAPGSLPPQW